jgi:hypothetical protein
VRLEPPEEAAFGQTAYPPVEGLATITITIEVAEVVAPERSVGYPAGSARPDAR